MHYANVKNSNNVLNRSKLLLLLLENLKMGIIIATNHYIYKAQIFWRLTQYGLQKV
jgi:hypothetical protein